MDRRIAWAVAAVGAVLLVVSALADALGIGDDGGFGWKQITGVVVGALIVAIGAWLLYGRRAGEPISES